jgi:hypothetical protein
MSSVARIILTGLVIVMFAAGTVLAVGYERVSTRSARIQPSAAEKLKDGPAVWKAVNDAFRIEKVPSAIDRAALTIKDIAGQFGIGRDNSRR